MRNGNIDFEIETETESKTKSNTKANPTGAEHTDATVGPNRVAEISRLGDQDLLLKAKSLATEERKITASLLVHLREIEKRRLFAKLGFGSLFAYVTEELGYCAASAQARICSQAVDEPSSRA